MADWREDAVTGHLHASLDALTRAVHDAAFATALIRVADAICTSLRNGGKVLLAGNGGSAADAQHIAAELLVRLKINRDALPAIALTTDSSVLTAIGNDFGFDHLFARQVRGLGRTGDVFIAISTSGRSPNILNALAAARDIGLVTIGFTGAGGGDMPAKCDLVLAAPAERTDLIQQIHITAAHAICDIIERALFGKQNGS
ncbi:MAG TPA: D-sedoheptulose 7-phosphate isomerase [Xanthobacteraceae bacterium]|nr:D-sedoheptulose 7-phosphate isomerase [Xanthobacteraceae bacterium]